jgi:hypothetical protein
MLAGCTAVSAPGAAEPASTAAATTTAATAASTATSTGAAPTTASTAQRTRVISFQPWHNGQVDSSLRVVSTTQGNCPDQSSATSRPDAYRCFAGNEVADPCFADTESAGSNQVACVGAPNEVMVVTLTSPLSPSAPDTATEDPPFLLILADGTACHASTGAGPDPRNGVDATMYCGSGETFVWGQPDSSADTWTVRVGTDTGPLTTARVRTVYR